LDVDAEEAVTERRSPWAVGVSSRILCKRLSDPESTSGDGALPVSLAWPMPCVGDLTTSALWKAIEQYHHCIPKDLLVQWVDNMKSYVDHASRDGHIATACGCSGTVMWRHCNDALLDYWSEEFGIADVGYDHKFVSEILPWKANFARLQHGIPHCFPDLGSLCDVFSYCSFDRSLAVIEWVQEFGGGFSCTQLSKANNRRKEHIALPTRRVLLAELGPESATTLSWLVRPCLSSRT
jgi:hypothetical protein